MWRLFFCIVAIVLLLLWSGRRIDPQVEPWNPFRVIPFGILCALLAIEGPTDPNQAGMPREPKTPKTCIIMSEGKKGHVLPPNHAQPHDSAEPNDLAYRRVRVYQQIQVRDSRGRFTSLTKLVEIDND